MWLLLQEALGCTHALGLQMPAHRPQWTRSECRLQQRQRTHRRCSHGGTSVPATTPQCQTEGDSAHHNIYGHSLFQTCTGRLSKVDYSTQPRPHDWQPEYQAQHSEVEIHGQMSALHIVTDQRDSLSQVVRWTRWFWCYARFVT